MAKGRTKLGRGLDALMGIAEYSTQPAPEPQPIVEAPKRESAREVIRESDLSSEDRETITMESNEVNPYGKSWQSQRAVVSPEVPVQASDDQVELVGEQPRNAYVETPVAAVAENPAPAPIPAPIQETSVEDTQVKLTDEVPIDMVYPNPGQPRTHFNQDELEELSCSIKKDGLLQPILVRELGNGYEIIAGERRWQASKKAGLSKVPIRIKEADDYQVLELALIENLQRSDLNPIEEAYGYKRMMERGSKTQSEIAAAVSKGRSTIANALRLLDLPEDAQRLLYEGVITAGHARAILSIPSEEGKKKLTERLEKEKLSVRETEAIARLLALKDNPKPKEPKAPAPKLFRSTARSLTKKFGNKVKVRNTGGKNKIEIEFKDEEDLQRIFDLINAAQ